MFQGFALCIETFLSRWRDRDVSSPVSERTKRSLWRTFQARNRLCFDASRSSSKSWIAFGVIDMGSSVQNNISIVNSISRSARNSRLKVTFTTNIIVISTKHGKYNAPKNQWTKASCRFREKCESPCPLSREFSNYRQRNQQCV